jgi:hypothetical protein
MEEKKEIHIHNLKSKQYREVFTDGASLGITPSGYFHLNFFAQRNAIPKGMVFEVTDGGEMGQIKSILPESKSGIVRQHEIGLYLDFKTCESLRDLLNQKIDEYRKFIENK